jgi:hypothetical protein
MNGITSVTTAAASPQTSPNPATKPNSPATNHATSGGQVATVGDVKKGVVTANVQSSSQSSPSADTDGYGATIDKLQKNETNSNFDPALVEAIQKNGDGGKVIFKP